MVVLFRPVFPLLEYRVNYTYIATVLCENKGKPQLACNGQCHLKKELAKQADADGKKDTPKDALKKAGLSVFVIPEFGIQFTYLLPKLVKNSWGYYSFYTCRLTKILLRPPISI